MSVILLLILIVYDTSMEIQQVVVAIIGLLLLASFTAFKQVINFDHKSSLSAQYAPYFDSRVITSNTFYNYEFDLIFLCYYIFFLILFSNYY